MTQLLVAWFVGNTNDVNEAVKEKAQSIESQLENNIEATGSDNVNPDDQFFQRSGIKQFSNNDLYLKTFLSFFHELQLVK